MLRILCLDGIRLVIGDVRLVVKIKGMFYLDVTPLNFWVNGVAHVGWCLPG